MGLDLDGVQKRKEQEESSGGGAEWRGQDRSTLWKPDEGRNEIFLLPFSSAYFERDVGDIAIRYNMHFLTPEGYNGLAVRCPIDAGQDYCPACEASDRWRDSDDPARSELAWSVFRSQRRLMNILDLANPEAGIQPYESGVKVYKKLLGIVGNPKWGDVINPGDGNPFDLVKHEGKKPRDVDYSVEPDPEARDIRKFLPDDWKNRLDELDSYAPELVDNDLIKEYLEALGFPVDRPSTVSAPDSGSSNAAGAEDQSPTQSDAETDDEDESGATETEGKVDEPEPEAEEGPDLDEEPVASAVERAEELDLPLINPPADSEESGIPFCFGEYEPKERPCDGCAVEDTCMKANLGVL